MRKVLLFHKPLFILVVLVSLLFGTIAYGQAFTFAPASTTTEHETEEIIKLDPAELVIAKGKSKTINPLYDETLYGKGAKFVWSSSDKKTATVNNNGMVQGVSEGIAIITCDATFKDGTTANATNTVTVYKPVQSFSAKATTLKVFAGQTQDAVEVNIKPADATYKLINWSTSDKSIATVDKTGRITGVAGGKATITGSLEEPGMKTQKSIKIQVTVTQSVSSIVLSDKSITIGKGKTQKITATAKPDSATNKKVTWSSSNDKIATVSNGTITGKKAGTCTITATASDGSGAKASCTVTVIQQVTSIKPDNNRRFVHVGKTIHVSATALPADATNKKLKWSSADTSCATIDQYGTITGKRAGTCKVYAEATDGSNTKTTITIIVEPANPISLDSIGFGIYNYNLLGLTVTNLCKTRVIKDFDFDMVMYNYMGAVVNRGSYSLGTQVSIAAKNQRTIKRTVYGVGQAYKITITITGVLFSDGEFYSIPTSLQETWSFTR